VEPNQLPVSKLRKPLPWKRIIAWTLLVSGIAGTVVCAKPIYREGKAWRARRLSLEVESLVLQGQMEKAFEKARAAYQLKPDEPASIRAVARAEGGLRRHQSALGFWKQLRDQGAMETRDRNLQAEDLLRAGLAGAAEEELKDLIQLQPENAYLERLAAQAAFNVGNRVEGRRHAERAVKLDPQNAEGRLLLGLLLWEVSDPAEQKRGMELVYGVASDQGRPGLDALLALSRRQDLSLEQVEKLAEFARVHPLATGGQRLLALDIRLKAQPEKSEELMETALKSALAGSADDRRALGVWFNTRKEYERTLKVVSLEEALLRKDLLLVHLDALAASKRWDDVAGILKKKDAPLDDVYRELFLARSAMERGDQGVADVHWRRAHLAVGVSSEQAWYVAGYAERLGRNDQAEIAYRSLTSKATTARPAYEALLRLAERRDDSEALGGLLRAMRERWPADAAVENDSAYFNLLLGVYVPEAVESARRLVAGAPGSLPHRTTLALGLLKSGDAGAALRVYESVNVPWNQVPASQRAVYCAVLSANGRQEEARILLKGLDVATLRRLERRLLEGLGSGALATP
jgi:hypothetical protein